MEGVSLPRASPGGSEGRLGSMWLGQDWASLGDKLEGPKAHRGGQAPEGKRCPRLSWPVCWDGLSM